MESLESSNSYVSKLQVFNCHLHFFSTSPFVFEMFLFMFFFLSNLLKTLQDALILICSKLSLLLLKRLPRVSVSHYLHFNLSLSIIVFRMIIVFQLNWEGYIKMGCTTVI